MQTIIIDILNEKAVILLKDLESLQLIKLRLGNTESSQTPINKWDQYKGAMTKQPLAEVDKQLADLREEWG